MQFQCNRRALVLASWGLCIPIASAATAQTQTILILGDSLSAEYGLERGKGWVALLTQRLDRERVKAKVVNASISGETTSGGLARLPTLLDQHRPSIVVIELGANDALRGLPLRGTHDNLNAMVAASQTQGAKVLLVGMQMPPNFGKRYSEDFAGLFKEVAQARRCAVVPFLLKGVADRPDARDWFQHDGIHPTAKAHPIMLENVWGALNPLLLRR